MRTNKFLVLATVFALACGDKDDTGAGGSDDTGGGDDGTTDDTGDDTGETRIAGSISGTVTVQLYEVGSDGERDELAWEDSNYYDGSSINWPYGNIYVGAYYVGASGGERYVGSTVINSPTESNPYTLDYAANGDQSVWVYASIDNYGDRVVGSGDFRGVYPIEVPIADGDAISDVDITILATNLGGDGGCGTIAITGMAEVTVSYSSGQVATMLVTTGGEGPYHSTIVTPTATVTGAEGAYSLTSCQSYGEMKVVGAWDRNEDGMFAPDDLWGSYVVSGAESTVTVGATDLSSIDVSIPFGDSPGVSVVPFVKLEGEVTVAGGAFDDLPPGSKVYVAALKYRPTGGFDITTSDALYDSEEFEWPDLTGESSKSFSLTVPASSRVYLWAYADTDTDGNVNESGEPVASGGVDDNGRLDTTTSSQSGITMGLATAGTR
jgi:hypothetical protein